MSEVKRGAVRIAANYAKLGSTLVMGLYWVPLMLRCVHDDAFGLIAFLGTNAGIAIRIRNVINRSMVRELGVAYHRDDPDVFLRTYNCAIVVALATSVATLVLQFALLFLLPFFSVSEDLLTAGRWFIVAKGVETSFTIALAPAFSFYLVDERMTTHNFWLVAMRSANVVAALVVLSLSPLAANAGFEEISHNMIFYGWLSAVIAMLMLSIPVLYLLATDKRFLPNLSLANWPGVRQIVTVGGWAASMDLSISGFMVAIGFYMFGILGAVGGRIYGVAVPLTFYVRMLATGMAAGLDAVSARITTRESDHSLKKLVYHSTRLNAFVVFPSILFIVIFAEQIVTVWVGARLNNPQDIQLIAHLIYALAIGTISMGIADAWINVLYGAGHIQRIAPMIIASFIAYCLLTPVVIWLTPPDWKYLAPVAFCSAVMLLAFCVGVSFSVARVLDIQTVRVWSPIARPLIASIAALPSLIPFHFWVVQWTLPALILAMLQYGTVYVILTWFFVLRSNDRSRLAKAIKTRAFRHDDSQVKEHP